MVKDLIEIGILFVTIVLLLIIFNLNGDTKKNGKLYITEIMASNTKTLKDNYGEYSDYIELYNDNNFPINLENYYLSSNIYEKNKWKFSKIEIKPKEYLIIYASGLDECDIKERICHTNFKLNSKGEKIILSDKNNNLINEFVFKEQYKDISYGYINGKYIYFNTPTPGKKNIYKEYKVQKNLKYDIEITEYMTHNKRSVYDSHGNYYDWIEIFNKSNKDYKLESLYITDNSSNLKKYKLPTATIKAKEYLVIYFSGKKEKYDDSIYVDFRLSDNDDYIIISNDKEEITKARIVKLNQNISYGKVNDKWYYFTTPTPGRDNDTAYFESIGG